MELIVSIIFIIVFLYSVVLHEIAHGYVAYRFGDSTARDLGRLSLNPIVHIDPIGSILVPALLFLSNTGLMFGWAKPVPVNPYNLKGGDKAYRWVTLAGVGTNLVLAVISAIVLKVTTQYAGLTFDNLGVVFFTAVMQINLILAVFNMLPFPGFDGFNFLNTFRPISNFIIRTPLGDPMFMTRYGLVLSIVLLMVLFPFVGLVLGYVFRYFLAIFGLGGFGL